MISRPQRIVALRQTQPDDKIKRQWVTLEAPPVATPSPVEAIMHRWWQRADGYPVGKRFASSPADRA